MGMNMKASYGMYKLDSDDKFKFLCKQELGTISPSYIDGSFEKVIDFLNKEKEYYKHYLDGCKVKDYYLEDQSEPSGPRAPRKEKFVNEFREDKITVCGLRELDDLEKAFKEAEDKKIENKKQREKREQYEKLKKEFGE